MKLLLERIFTCSRYTIGRLYLVNSNGTTTYLMDTLEDADRGLDNTMDIATITKKKIYCQTAIPTGTYKVVMHVKSPSFSQKAYYKAFCGGYMPRLVNVKGYEGILMHRGTNEGHSCGCLLLGKNTIKGQLTDSQWAFEKLMNDYLLPCKKSGENITITIKRKYKL